MGLFTRSILVCFIVVSLAFATSVGNSYCIVGSDEAEAKISEAEAALRHAFSAVLDAESAGANVSELLVQLDAVGGNLTEAETAYSSGDFNEASSRAQQCAAVAGEIFDEASNLDRSVLANSGDTEWRTIGFSIIGGLAFVLIVALVWVFFRRSYLGKLSNMKPEISS